MGLEGWRRVRLGEVLEPISRLRAVEPDRSYPLLGVRWYGNGCHLHDTIHGSKLKTPVLNAVATGDVTYNKMWVSKGAFAVVDEGHGGLFATSEYPIFQAAPEVAFPPFLRNAFKAPGFVSLARESCRGTTSRARLNPKDFLELPIALPPLGEQRKIAAILSSLDDAIEATQAVIDQLQVVKKAMMAELLTRGIPGRHTRFKQTEIGEVPENWKVDRVGDCCTIRNDLRKPINKADRAKIPGPFPYYGPTRAVDSINEWRLDGTFALIGEDGDHFLKFDRWAMTQLVSGRFNVNNHAHVVAGTARCSAEWFAAFFQHRDLTAQLTRQGANRYKLRKATLENLLVPIPSPEEQETIVRSIASVGLRTAVEDEVVLGVRQLKSALMSVLLTGELRVAPDGTAA